MQAGRPGPALRWRRSRISPAALRRGWPADLGGIMLHGLTGRRPERDTGPSAIRDGRGSGSTAFVGAVSNDDAAKLDTREETCRN